MKHNAWKNFTFEANSYRLQVNIRFDRLKKSSSAHYHNWRPSFYFSITAQKSKKNLMPFGASTKSKLFNAFFHQN